MPRRPRARTGKPGRDNPREIDWRDPQRERLEPDHLATDRMRPRGMLRAVTLRLGVEQIAEARRTSDATGVPYQAVLREWIAAGAAESQRRRRARRL
jgi:hypothetical protein